MKCDIAYDPQVPAEIRHEGGETLRTSFSRDLAKWVNNVTIVLGSEVVKIKLSDLESKHFFEKCSLILYNANICIRILVAFMDLHYSTKSQTIERRGSL